MKILHTVESYLPARNGMSEVVRQVSERLVAKGHDVTVATGHHSNRKHHKINGVKVVSFPIYGKSAVRIIGNTKEYEELLLQPSFDVVVNFAAQQWATDVMLPILQKIRAKKVLVPTGFSALEDPQFANYFEGMRLRLKEYDACVYLSANYRDINFARANRVGNEAIITNAAAADEFEAALDSQTPERLGISKDDKLILHVSGYLSVAKGQVEAIRIFGESQIQNTTLLLICSEFSQGLSAGLHPRNLARGAWQLLRGRGLSGFLPAGRIAFWIRKYRDRNSRFGRRIMTASLTRKETVDCFQRADALLFPSWIECSPIVLFEAAASGTPFLVTDVGNAKEIISWTGGGELLPGLQLPDREGSVVADIAGGARVLDSLWSDPERRAAMATSARKAWNDHFTWEKIADRYEELYKALVAGESITGRFVPPPKVCEV